MQFGLIGYGRFGRLWAKALQPYGKILVYDAKTVESPENYIEVVSLDRVVQADLLFLLVPISEIENTCNAIAKLLSPETLVIDCCSVKIYPIHLMQTLLPIQQPIIGSHPLFGPDSVAKSGGLDKHRIVLCQVRSTKQQFETFKSILEKMGLTTIVTTPEDHDEQMAHSQSLIHFIGRGLEVLHIHPQVLATPDFNALLNINKMVVHDSWQLFYDMHQYNPYAASIRKKFMQELLKIDSKIGR